VGAAVAASLGYALKVPVVGLHHLEGHLLSPLLTSPAPRFPFIALLVSGGHTQLMRVDAVGEYQLLGETVTTPPARPSTRLPSCWLALPRGSRVVAIGAVRQSKRFKLPRPMLASGDLNFSFSGLKTAVLTLVRGADPDSRTKPTLPHRFSRRSSKSCGQVVSAVAREGLDHWWSLAASAPIARYARPCQRKPNARASRCSTRRRICAPTTGQ